MAIIVLYIDRLYHQNEKKHLKDALGKYVLILKTIRFPIKNIYVFLFLC